MPENKDKAPGSVCASCGASFVCGVVAGLASCWCMEKAPTAIEPTAGGSCYCPNCLAERSSRTSAAATGEPSPAA
ncbi:cysteine-rich CWC family protein [Candidatus Accumulibacter sp. ACC003]|uniref:cysteine-rich CWC family protein n=1 Tax=Candidatus Accumulibacter sp. ACC003 TaxID=2823334 RepID=UPI0025BDB4D3|nr:cysteine-rich CWC family protein [Candidatus Accumulibacter sp. ACC003]